MLTQSGSDLILLPCSHYPCFRIFAKPTLIITLIHHLHLVLLSVSAARTITRQILQPETWESRSFLNQDPIHPAICNPVCHSTPNGSQSTPSTTANSFFKICFCLCWVLLLGGLFSSCCEWKVLFIAVHELLITVAFPTEEDGLQMHGLQQLWLLGSRARV